VIINTDGLGIDEVVRRCLAEVAQHAAALGRTE
jgi:hypothetical protein